MARLDEGDVAIGDTNWTITDEMGDRSVSVMGFVGKFVAPKADYGRNSPRLSGDNDR